MSAAALAWAWRQPIADKSAKLLLIKLADQANDDGICWPSRRTLSAECVMHEETITKKTALLKQAGLIEIEERYRENGSRTSNVYRLLCGDPPPQIAEAPSAAARRPEPPLEPTREPDGSLDMQAKRKRPRDPVWDALVDVFGTAPAGMERGRWNKAAQSLREAGATSEQVRAAAARYPRVMPEGCVMTPTALASNWTILLGAPEPRERGSPRVTGWRLVRGTHGTTYVKDDSGTDHPPRGYS